MRGGRTCVELRESWTMNNGMNQWNLDFLQAMQETLLRRGPDQKGIWQADFVSLIHARLSIIDLDNGQQPMQRENCCMVYNGELYNSEELRQELVQDGWSFATQSDTEVVLVSYLQWKEKCVERMNGIFAFAVWDTYRKELFVARDPMGVKPFFYAFRNHAFLFGSELKTLLAHPFVEPKIDAGGNLAADAAGTGSDLGECCF